jgi:predicted nuclease with RNAse H fold
MDVFVGIDVACAKLKPLPICVVKAEGAKVIPLEFRVELPRGPGNIEIAKPDPFRALAKSVTADLEAICRRKGWHIKRLAVDAPAAAPAAGQQRFCEEQMSKRKLHSFQTPNAGRWDEIKKSCNQHLKQGGLLSELPYANKIWMLYGFELFFALRSITELQVIEVYPYAIVCELLPGCAHKSTKEGYNSQLSEIALRTGWSTEDLEKQLRFTTFGGKHDRLDAFMAAWTASLPPQKLKVYGHRENANDSIWIPDRELLQK